MLRAGVCAPNFKTVSAPMLISISRDTVKRPRKCILFLAVNYSLWTNSIYID